MFENHKYRNGLYEKNNTNLNVGLVGTHYKNGEDDSILYYRDIFVDSFIHYGWVVGPNVKRYALTNLVITLYLILSHFTYRF